MGALISCFSDPTKIKKSSSVTETSGSSIRLSKLKSARKGRSEEELIHDLIERSASMRYYHTPGLKKETMIRSSSARSRSIADPLVQPHQFVGQVRGEIGSYIELFAAFIPLRKLYSF